MDQLVDYAEEGRKLDTHDDVPEGIREAIRARKDEQEARKRRKRKATDPLPITVRLCCHGHHDDRSDDSDCPEMRGLTRGARLKFPMPIDEAPYRYSDWLCNSVTNDAWLASFRLASSVTIDKGYDLQWLYDRQTAGAEILVKGGVLECIATPVREQDQRMA
jgi:hypothetical protein